MMNLKFNFSSRPAPLMLGPWDLIQTTMYLPLNRNKFFMNAKRLPEERRLSRGQHSVAEFFKACIHFFFLFITVQFYNQLPARLLRYPADWSSSRPPHLVHVQDSMMGLRKICKWNLAKVKETFNSGIRCSSNNCFPHDWTKGSFGFGKRRTSVLWRRKVAVCSIWRQMSD